VRRVVESFPRKEGDALEEVLEADKMARKAVRDLIESGRVH